MHSILEGIRVISWTQFIIASTAGAKLGDLGADVIKVEQRGRGDGTRGLSPYRGVPLDLPGGYHAEFEIMNRSQRGITLDLTKPPGKEVMYRLVEKSDMLLTNIRAKARAKLSMTYEVLSRYNPKLIYISGNGFGEKGPDCDVGAFDLLGQARSGVMMQTGEPDMPPVLGPTGLFDQVTSMNMAFAAIVALLTREKYGVGQEITTSLLGSAIDVNPFMNGLYLFGKPLPRQYRSKPANPGYNWYKCKDGKWIATALPFDKSWPVLCEAVGIPEFGRDPRNRNNEEITSKLDGIFATKEYSEWATILRAADINFAAVNDFPDLLTDEQVIANEYIIEREHPFFGTAKYPGFPIKFGKTEQSIPRTAPVLGQHTEEVLLEIGYTWEEIEQLKDQEVI